MAEEGFKELIQQTKETNDLLRQQAVAEGKPDPIKFVKEEIFSILAEKKRHQENMAAQAKIAKEVDQNETQDQEYYAKQLIQQKGAANYLKIIAKSVQSQAEIAPKMLQLTDQRKNIATQMLQLTDQRIKLSGVQNAILKKQPGVLKAVVDTFITDSAIGQIPNLVTGVKNLPLNVTRGLDKGLQKLFGASGGSKAEGEQKQGFFQKKFLGALDGIKKATAGTFKQMKDGAKDRLKAGAKGLFGFLRKFGLGVLALALIALLNDPNFPKIAKRITKVIIPAIAKFYDKVLVPVGKKLKKAFDDLMEVLEGDKGLLEFIFDNKLALAAATALIAPRFTFGVIEMGAGLLGKGIKAAWGAEAVQKYMAGAQFKSIFGVGSILLGLAMATKDGFDGIAKSKEWNVDNISGFIGGFIGGTEKGIKGMFANAGKFALIGAGIGTFFFPPFGTLIGAAIGALLGGIAGYIGGERIAKFAQSIFDQLKEIVRGFVDSVLIPIKRFIPKSVLNAFGMKKETPAEEEARKARIAGVSVAELRKKKEAERLEDEFDKEVRKRRGEIFNLQRSGRRIGQSDAEKAAIGERVLQLQRELNEFKRKGAQAAANIDARSAITTDMSSSYSIGHYPLNHPSPVIEKLTGYGG